MRARGWTGLVVRRTLADRALTASAFLVVVAASTALVAAGIYPATAARQGAIRALEAADPRLASVTVSYDSTPADADATDAKVRSVLAGSLGSIGGTVVASGRSESYSPAGSTDANPTLAVFAFLDDLPAHAHLVSGTWPAEGGSELDAVITQPVADHLHATVGEVVPMTSRLAATRGAAVRITGIIALDDRADPAWGSDPLILGGATQAGPFTTVGPLFVTRDGLLARTVVARATLAWTAIPAFGGVATAELAGLAASTAAIHDRLAVSLGQQRSIDVRTGLPELLAGVSDRVAQAGSGTAVTAGQLLVLAVYALVLVAGLLVDRRRGSSTLLVARGAGTFHLLRLVTIEAVLLAVPAVLLGVPLGLAVVNAMSQGAVTGSGAALTGFAGSVATVTAGTALVAIAGFVAPTLVAVGPLARLRRTVSRRRAGALATRGGLDAALIALAVLGLWQLRAGAQAGSARVLGPLDVAAPAVALIAVAALSLRVTPAAARLVEVVLVRGTGAAGALGGRSISRRSSTAARPVLLLVAAAGIALFCVEFGRSWEGSQADQVAHAVAGDVAGTVPATATSTRWPAGAAYRGIPGVTAASAVLRATFDAGPGLRRGSVLAIPGSPALAGRAARGDLADRPLAGLLASLVAARPSLPLLPIPAGTRRVRIVASSTLFAVSGATLDQAAPPGLAATLVVALGDGSLVRLVPVSRDPSVGTPAAPVFVVALPQTEGASPSPAPAVAIVAVEVEVRATDGRPVAGGIGVTSLATTAGATGDDAWAPLDPVSTPDAWGMTRQSFGSGPVPVNADPAAPGTWPIPLDAPLTGPGASTLALRPLALDGLDAQPMVALADQATLDAGRAAAGATIVVQVGLDTRRLTTAGPLASFPGVDGPGIAVVDLGTWQLTRYGATGVVPAPTAWWLSTDGRDDAAVAAALAAGAYPLADLRIRSTETGARLGDPVAVAIFGTLDLVAVAALAFAAVGTLAASWTAGRGRRAEVAVLVALGLSRRQLVALVLSEETFPVALGLAGGTLLGLALGALALPAMIRASDGSAPIPPATLVVPWDVGLALAAAGVALVVLASLGRLRSIDRLAPAEALRRDAVGAEA